MRKDDAKEILFKYIKNNYQVNNKVLSHELNRNIINLSHRICKTRGINGHRIRQNIRLELQQFAKIALAIYEKNWKIVSPNQGSIKSPSIFTKILNFIMRKN